MGYYRKRPIVIEAVLWTGQNLPEVLALGGERGISTTKGNLAIETLEGTMTANKGDWIIKGVSGELYPCKPDIFERTYEPARGKSDAA